jgi:hypothetical protein
VPERYSEERLILVHAPLSVFIINAFRSDNLVRVKYIWTHISLSDMQVGNVLGFKLEMDNLLMGFQYLNLIEQRAVWEPNE